ncbi:MAG: hypothetical protein V1859_07585 [archaeon]
MSLDAKILYVEDSWKVAEPTILSLGIDHPELEFIHVKDHNTALSYLTGSHTADEYTLILLDRDFPLDISREDASSQDSPNGIYLAKLIRTAAPKGLGSLVPIIICSAGERADITPHLVGLDRIHYLEKPLDQSEFYHILNMYRKPSG